MVAGEREGGFPATELARGVLHFGEPAEVVLRVLERFVISSPAACMRQQHTVADSRRGVALEADVVGDDSC